ncbi:MAG: hypothetical protein ACYCW6_28865, partial [Candidatus Xenobia bacterium]
PERSELEYVIALAAIYESTQDVGLAIDGCYRWLCFRISRRLGRRGLSRLSEVVPLIETRYGIKDLGLQAAVDAAEQDRERADLPPQKGLEDVVRLQTLLSPIHKESIL